MRTRFKTHAFSLFGSLGIHAMLLAALGVWGIWEYLSVDQYGIESSLAFEVDPVEITTLAVDLRGAKYVRTDDKPQGIYSLQQMMKEAERSIAGLTDEETKKALQEKLAQLERFSSENIHEAALVIERLKGVDRDREYAPKAGVKGEFDLFSVSLYDIRKIVKENGDVVYVIVWVDKKGRTMVDVVKEEDMIEQDLTAYTVFEMGRGHPVLRRLVDTVRMMQVARGEKAARAKSKQDAKRKAPTTARPPERPSPESEREDEGGKDDGGTEGADRGAEAGEQQQQ